MQNRFTLLLTALCHLIAPARSRINREAAGRTQGVDAFRARRLV